MHPGVKRIQVYLKEEPLNSHKVNKGFFLLINLMIIIFVIFSGERCGPLASCLIFFRHVNDIDLFTGAVTEEPLDGALVGPTLACIIGLQLKALKVGDRFYYENNEPNTAFSLAQLDEIKKTTLAKVICRNTNIGKIQENVFIHGYLKNDIP